MRSVPCPCIQPRPKLIRQVLQRERLYWQLRRRRRKARVSSGRRRCRRCRDRRRGGGLCCAVGRRRWSGFVGGRSRGEGRQGGRGVVWRGWWCVGLESVAWCSCAVVDRWSCYGSGLCRVSLLVMAKQKCYTWYFILAACGITRRRDAMIDSPAELIWHHSFTKKPGKP